MQKLQAGPTQRAVVIVVDQALIARDIELIVKEMRPDVTVIVARNVSEIATALTPDIQIELAFVDAIAVAMALSGGNSAHWTGSRVVLIGHDQDAVPKQNDWALLPYPFTNRDVQNLLAQPA